MAMQLTPVTSSEGIPSTAEISSNISTNGALQTASHTVVCGENYNNLLTIVPDINFNINEYDFDDDDFDEEFSDEFYEDDDMTDVQAQTSESNDMTKQLLDFAQQVNSDIQKYFGRKKDEDSCDIYEDKWTSKKSGRELYLADILRIANGGDPADETKKTARKSQAESKRNDMNGKVNKNVGLGPLDELFRDFQKDARDSVNKVKKPKRLQTCYGKATSLQDRKLPSSFWIEPITKQGAHDVNKITGSNTTKTTPSEVSSSQGKSAMQAPSTPDFSDLLDSWTGEESSSPVKGTHTTIRATFAGQNSSITMDR